MGWPTLTKVFDKLIGSDVQRAPKRSHLYCFFMILTISSWSLFCSWGWGWGCSGLPIYDMSSDCCVLVSWFSICWSESESEDILLLSFCILWCKKNKEVVTLSRANMVHLQKNWDGAKRKEGGKSIGSVGGGAGHAITLPPTPTVDFARTPALSEVCSASTSPPLRREEKNWISTLLLFNQHSVILLLNCHTLTVGPPPYTPNFCGPPYTLTLCFGFILYHLMLCFMPSYNVWLSSLTTLLY